MNPQQALERAVCTWLKTHTLTNIAATSIYKGLENTTAIDDEENNTQPQTKAHPSVTLEAEGQHQEAIFATKVYQGNLLVTVEADAQNTTDDTFNTICREVFGKFDIQELATNISAFVDDFTILFIRIIQNGHSIKAGQNWINYIRLDVVYAEADL